jgi:hypothetical protein
MSLSRSPSEGTGPAISMSGSVTVVNWDVSIVELSNKDEVSGEVDR